MIFQDSNFPNLAVGAKLFSVAEASKYITHNWEALERKLRVRLNAVDQWQKDLEAAGGVVQAFPEINESLKPRAWLIARVVTMVSGHQQLYLERPISEGSKHLNHLVVMTSDLDGTFVASFDDYLTERLQDTVDRIISQKAQNLEREKNQRDAQKQIELTKAQAVMKRDANMSDAVRTAYHTDGIYVATLEGAAKIVANASKSAKQQIKAKKQRVIDSRQHAQKQANGKRCAKSKLGLAQAYTNQAKGRLKRAKAKGEPLPDLEADLKQKLTSEAEAKAALSGFQC